MILTFPAEKPLTDQQYQAALQKLERRFECADERTRNIPEAEWEQIPLEAMGSVRPGYQERR